MELAIMAASLLAGMTTGFIGSRRDGRWFPALVVFGILACIGIALGAAKTYACPAGADCDPVTWANWTWAGIAMVGWWLLAVAMGYALSIRFRQ